VVILENVVKTYESPRGLIRALDNVSLRVEDGEFVAIRGPSGSGKTTLLMIVAAMLRVSSGTVKISGTELDKMSSREKEEFRSSTIGFAFQMFHLIPYLNVLENVLLAARRESRSNAESKAADLLKGLEMQHRIYHRPAELSTGERQRTAIARALLNGPKLFLADEPTGNLDPENACAVLEYLRKLNEKGCTVILATHEAEAENYAQKVVSLDMGRVVQIT